jgi:cytochrome c oxidase subunit 2
MNLDLWPRSASEYARSVDWLVAALTAFSGLLVLVLSVFVIVFAIRYRRGSPADRSGRRRRSAWREFGWTAPLVVIAFVLFGWSGALYLEQQQAPADALEVYGIGKQWMWKFQHHGGQREINELHVPVGQPVKLILRSQDVIHSFFVPAFRVKQDVLPGRLTTIWFNATRPGQYHLMCAEYCGTAHSRMRGRVVALEGADYAHWLARQAPQPSLAARGERLSRSLGCTGCHGPNAHVRAPSWVGLFGRPVPLAGGGTIVANEAYLRDSIVLPTRHIVAGYRPIMPSFAGQVADEDVSALIEYIKSLADEVREGP